MLQAVMMLLGAVVGQAAPVAGDELQLEVRRLVRQLDARELADREAAEKTLIEKGPKVLDLLPPDGGTASAEVKQRLGRIRVQLQKQQAAAAAAESEITLKGERLALEEIFRAIEAQTGNKIVVSGGEQGAAISPVRLTVDYSNAPFWPTFDEILDRTGLALYSFAPDRSLQVSRARDGAISRRANASYNGPFRFAPARIDLSRDLRTARDSSLALTIEVAWEPRFRPISLQQRLSEIEVSDERGKPLPIVTREAILEIPVSAEAIGTEIRIPIEAPPRSVEKIGHLRGTLRALMQGKTETFTFDLPKAEKSEQRAAGVTVILEQVRKNRDVWEIRIAARFDDAAGALASHRTWVYDNAARLITPSGAEIPFHAFDSVRQTENEVGVAYFFGIEGDLQGYKFVYETASSVLTASFDYQFSDIRLP